MADDPLFQLALSALQGVAVPVYQALANQGVALVRSGATNVLQDAEFKAKLDATLLDYARRYHERWGKLKVLGMREPINLQDLYVATHFLRGDDLRRVASVAGMEQTFRQRVAKDRLRDTSQQRQNGIAVANEHPFLMVLGGPGAGKSTFLKRIGLEALAFGSAKNRYKHACLPVFLELKTWDDKADLLQKLAAEFELCGFPQPQRFVSEALAQGKLLVLLDGLDEVPSHSTDAVIKQVQDQVDKHDKNRFIVSCRIAAYTQSFRRFTDIGMADFNDAQVKTFVRHWFKPDPDPSAAEGFWQALKMAEHTASEELAHTPLLLTLLCLTYQKTRQFPATRANLYQKALDVLLEEWWGEKGIKAERVYEQLDTRRKYELLADIAYHTFADDRLFFSRNEILPRIERHLREVLPDKTVIDGDKVLRDIERQHGVIVEYARNIMSFSHLTFQEFFAAYYLRDVIAQDSNALQHLVSEKALAQDWREVFLLLAGLLPRVDAVLQAMMHTAAAQLRAPKLHRMLTWAKRITKGTGARQLVLSVYFGLARSLALAFALDRALALALALGWFDISDTSTGAIRIIKTEWEQRGEKMTLEQIRDWIKRATNALYAVIELDDEWPNLNEDEVKQLANHLYICELMVQCRKAANRVTPSVWEEVQAQILAVPPPLASSSLPLPMLDRKALFNLIFKYFDLDEIKGVCFEMGIEYESLPGDGTRDDKVRGLIQHCDRHNRKHELLHTLRELHPAAFEGLT
ncbi:MAG: NACHT domain-containing protein [Anaerolineae bacterium]|nr:NACHT domain-containing protein [Anaerolineae bacterium]